MLKPMFITENDKPRSHGKNDMWLLFIELLLYFSMTCRIFGSQLGVLSTTGLSGAIIVASGLLCLLFMICSNQSIPKSIYFAFVINVIASITDLYMYDQFSRNMVYWISFQLMACFIVRNERALLRFAFLLATAIFLSVYLGGEFYGQDLSRLTLAGDKVGSMFANPNALAHFAALTATALLFCSLKCKIIMRSICVACALALSAIVLMTLSRGGLMLLLIGLIFFLLAVLFGRGLRMSLLILGVFTATLLTVFSTQFDDISAGYYSRVAEDSDRTQYLLTAKKDMLDTFVSGYGFYDGFSSTGMKPHNSFLWLHFAFGGFCAWIYVGWVVWLGYATVRGVLLGGLNWPAKMEMLAFFIMFVAIQFISIFPPFNFGFVLGFAIIEKHIWLSRPPVHGRTENCALTTA